MKRFIAYNTFLDHTFCNLRGLELVKVYCIKNKCYAFVSKLKSQVEGLYFDDVNFDCYYIPNEERFRFDYIKSEARKTRSIIAKEYARDLIYHINRQNEDVEQFEFFTNTITKADYKTNKTLKENSHE